jgi:ParB/RepB/Spo0J family partition protein
MILETSKLVVGKDNPRKTKASQQAHDALVASIRYHGLIQPLVVRPSADNDNIYEVIDGGRRFAAIKEAGIDRVEVIVNEAEFGVAELGTAANMMRAAMHPLDEASVISRLVADGENIEDVAGRFGQTPKWAAQRVKLDALSPTAKNMFRAGTFGIASAEALTLGSKAEQDAYLKKAKSEYQLEPRSILAHFTQENVKAENALFSLDKYPEQYILRDLFSEDVFLTNRALFEEMQQVAIGELVEKLLAEGWSDVLKFLAGPDYAVMGKYVKAEGHIKKADRSKYVAVVVYTPRSGAVSCDRGYVLRKAAGKIAVGKEAGEDVAAPEEVKPLTCFDLSESQIAIAGALATDTLRGMIGEGDAYLAYRTLCGGLLLETGDPWVGLRRSATSYININTMLTNKLPQPEPTNMKKFPSRTDFAKMSEAEVQNLVCSAALNAFQTMSKPDKEALKVMREADLEWFTFDEGFLKRYRLDALQDLAKRLGIEYEGLKKKDLVAAVLAYDGDRAVVPVK